MEKDLREAALEYHRWPTPGKISVRPTKGLTNQRDLALLTFCQLDQHLF